MEALQPLISVALELVSALENAGIEYALGGALAYGFWGEPRGTKDIDVSVFLELQGLDRVFGVLETLGAKTDREEQRRQASETGMFVAHLHRYRVDVFIPDIPLYDTARSRRFRANLGGKPVFVWSAEDIALFKLLYFRPKDLLDLEKLIVINRQTLDFEYIRHWLHLMVGPDDERTAWFERRAESSSG